MDLTFVSIIFADKEAAQKNLSVLPGKDLIKIRGKEVLIFVPECGLPFSLNQLRGWLLSPAKVNMFNLEHYPSGRRYRDWYKD